MEIGVVNVGVEGNIPAAESRQEVPLLWIAAMLVINDTIAVMTSVVRTVNAYKLATTNLSRN